MNKIKSQLQKKMIKLYVNAPRLPGCISMIKLFVDAPKFPWCSLLHTHKLGLQLSCIYLHSINNHKILQFQKNILFLDNKL